MVKKTAGLDCNAITSGTKIPPSSTTPTTTTPTPPPTITPNKNSVTSASQQMFLSRKSARMSMSLVSSERPLCLFGYKKRGGEGASGGLDRVRRMTTLSVSDIANVQQSRNKVFFFYLFICLFCFVLFICLSSLFVCLSVCLLVLNQCNRIIFYIFFSFYFSC